jgi:hypothetical protein
MRMRKHSTSKERAKKHFQLATSKTKREIQHKKAIEWSIPQTHPLNNDLTSANPSDTANIRV